MFNFTFFTKYRWMFSRPEQDMYTKPYLKKLRKYDKNTYLFKLNKINKLPKTDKYYMHNLRIFNTEITILLRNLLLTKILEKKGEIQPEYLKKNKENITSYIKALMLRETDVKYTKIEFMRQLKNQKRKIKNNMINSNYLNKNLLSICSIIYI